MDKRPKAISSRLRWGCNPARTSHNIGAVLLEVILSIALFFYAAGVINMALHSALHSADRLRMEATADDLMTTVLSYIQMGVIERNDAGPEFFSSPYDQWTWTVAITSPNQLTEIDNLQQVDITVRSPNGSFSRTLTQWLADDPVDTQQAVAGTDNSLELQ